jgi:hypothetical protein
LEFECVQVGEDVLGESQVPGDVLGSLTGVREPSLAALEFDGAGVESCFCDGEGEFRGLFELQGEAEEVAKQVGADDALGACVVATGAADE